MKNRTIYITDADMEKLRGLLETARRLNYYDRADLQELEVELNRAKKIRAKRIPHDVITMNSTVCLVDLESGEEMTYTLVLPSEADIDKHKISVLAPIGTAMLGYRVGDTLEWQVPGGISRLKVKAILYQPEANGGAEVEVADFTPPGQDKWRETLQKITRFHEVFDDYSYS